jgi:hypothetical protein
MTQAFQIGDIVRLKKTGKRCVITGVYRLDSGNIIHTGYEYDAPNIPPGTTRSDIPWAFTTDISAYAKHLILEVPSPWRRALANSTVVPMIGDQYTGPNGESTPQTVDSVNWVHGAIDVNRYPFTTDTVPSPEFTTF